LEGGFPAEVEFKVRYSVTEENSIVIEYLAIPDTETIINMTNHSYFNFSGNMRLGGEKQVLKLDSDFFCEVNEEALPTGKKIAVDGTKFDFRGGKVIEEGLSCLESDYNLKIQRVTTTPSFSIKTYLR
jgi:aldose 1-epimerase